MAEAAGAKNIATASLINITWACAAQASSEPASKHRETPPAMRPLAIQKSPGSVGQANVVQQRPTDRHPEQESAPKGSS